MRLGWTGVLTVVFGCGTIAAVGAGCGAVAAAPVPVRPLRAFADERALKLFVARRAERIRRSEAVAALPPMIVAAPPPVVAMPSVAAPEAAGMNDIVVTSARAAEPGITNTQEADVDEGGIVKVHGRHLVILRRGRLFTVALGEGTMRPVDRIDAFPPGGTGEEAWYDEMLVAGDRVVVIGYSYGRGGTEINRFRIDADGRLRFEDSHQLRSNDYYSASNYASRLIGNRLILYTGLELNLAAPLEPQLPALRRWRGSDRDAFRRIAPATRIYVPEPVRRDPGAVIDTLHTVTTCDLAAEVLDCRASGVLGSESREFYVSGNAVHVWIADAFERGNRALVYRLPLDGGRPGAVQAWGGPVDQFSFREDRAGGTLDVLVRADGHGSRMWAAEVSDGDAALLRLPIASFGDGSGIAPRRAYRALPLEPYPHWSFHNRFVGRWLLYAAGEFAEGARTKTVFAAPLDGGPVARLPVPHGVDRIDIMGSDAVAIGNDARTQLGFSAIELAGAAPRLGDTSLLPAAREGERRSQAFFYRPDPGSADGASGILGLPVTRDLREEAAARLLGSGSAIAFLRREARRFRPAGELAARTEGVRDDGCVASCVDWYGNARPIFLNGRIFALMGYELVEGRLRDGRIVEAGRIDFAPQAAPGR
ncbi:beta-propeller domain-containing protein [Sphingomonas silueang]|uniref:beta-propeller domain-containing protein n=1 Tax=Sphingomonas silueang TaxID=3156617 RepID=UPI0032B52E0D